MYKVSPPDIDDSKSFDVYKAKLKLEAVTTPVEKGEKKPKKGDK